MCFHSNNGFSNAPLWNILLHRLPCFRCADWPHELEIPTDQQPTRSDCRICLTFPSSGTPAAISVTAKLGLLYHMLATWEWPWLLGRNVWNYSNKAYTECGDRISSAGIGTSYVLDGQADTGVDKTFSASPERVGGPNCFLHNGYRISFPWVKQSGCGVDYPPHLAPRLKKEQNYTFTPLLGHTSRSRRPLIAKERVQSRSVLAGFMVDDVALGHINLEVLRISAVIFIPLVLDVHSFNTDAVWSQQLTKLLSGTLTNVLFLVS